MNLDAILIFLVGAPITAFVAFIPSLLVPPRTMMASEKF